MKNQLDEMMRKVVITPCASPWTAHVILVPKKSSDGKPKYRFCTDFRGLNSVTSIPAIKSNLSLVACSKYFTMLDIENAYWNIPIKEEDKGKIRHDKWYLVWRAPQLRLTHKVSE